MDEELGGVNPNSFFEQLTEVRGVAETAQKTSNSNLTLLKELKHLKLHRKNFDYDSTFNLLMNLVPEWEKDF